MAKTVEDVARALKLKAEPKENALTLRVGVKKFVLPFEVRVISSNSHIFVHIPPSAGIMQITDKGLAPVANLAQAQEATASFRSSKKRSTRKVRDVQMPNELAEALNKIPSGFKLSYGADGKPRLVKTRKRKK